jgi:hypothetical protein
MKTARIAFASTLAAVAALAAAPAQAYNSWCDGEPPLTVVMPSGAHVTINNFLMYEVQDRHLVKQAVVYGTAVPAGDGYALVTIYIKTPPGGHADIHVTSRTERFQQRAENSAAWGSVTALQLLLPDGPDDSGPSDSGDQ